MGSSILPLIPRERRGIIERSRARVAGLPKAPAIAGNPRHAAAPPTAGLPTNPETNYHSPVQPENTGRMVNRLPGRKPMTAVAFTISGKAVSVEAEPDTALLWVVREHLKLTGTKYGCGSGLCGACTVHIDGKAVRSCQTQMSAVGGKKVTTIEGLSPNSSHALQKAWIVEQVPQCGYCQSGQI